MSAARADLARALELGASPAETCYQLARVELAAGDREAARRHLSSALEADTDFAPAEALLVELDAAR
ncbi:MAG: hypothetical protein WD845_17240 [Pirellulales bacterium]